MMRPAAALLLLICPLLSTASFCDATGDWKLDWLEEFDSLDLDAWSVVQGNDEGSCRDALCTASNVKVSGGHLVITSKRENEGGYNFTTGAVQTAGKKHWAYKPKFRLCVSAMLPGGGGNGKGQGIWCGPLCPT